jgi:hypothetical protein
MKNTCSYATPHRFLRYFLSAGLSVGQEDVAQLRKAIETEHTERKKGRLCAQNGRFAHTTIEGLKIRNISGTDVAGSMERDTGNCYHQHVSVTDRREVKSNRKSTQAKERKGTNSRHLALWYH